MKLFKIEGQGHYAGGIVLVAAKNADQAASLGNEKSSSTWNIEFKAQDAIEIKTIKHTHGSPEVILHYEMGE